MSTINHQNTILKLKLSKKGGRKIMFEVFFSKTHERWCVFNLCIVLTRREAIYNVVQNLEPADYIDTLHMPRWLHKVEQQRRLKSNLARALPRERWCPQHPKISFHLDFD